MLESGNFAHLLTVDGWIVLVYEFGPPLVRAVLLAIGTWLAVRLAKSSFRIAARRADPHAQILVGRIITIAIVGIGAATVLDTLGVPLTTFVTVLGVAGLGISLAMQDVLKSFVAGTFLLFERPFRIGDEISVKDQRGIVEDVGIRTTRLRNADNVQFIIPNAVVFAEVVQNRTNEIKPEPKAAEPDPLAPETDEVKPVVEGTAAAVATVPPVAQPPLPAASAPPTR